MVFPPTELYWQKNIFFELHKNSSKERGKMRELIPNLCPQITNLDQRLPKWSHCRKRRKGYSYLSREETCNKYWWVWWLSPWVIFFPTAPPHANLLENKSLGLSPLGHRVCKHQGGPSLRSCCVWRSQAICAWGRGPAPPSHPPVWPRWEKGGG